jgi:hypothetical protein
MLLRQIILKLLFATPAGAPFDIRKTPFFSILCANPSVARFYPNLFRAHGANSSLIKDLETRSGKFFDPDQSANHQTTKASKGVKPMPANQNIRVCTHIKVNGVPCGSPALRGEIFCYFHQRMIRGVRTPPRSRIHPIALIESEEGIQASLMELINALVRNSIDFRRAQLVLRALHIAVRNSPHVHFNLRRSEMTQEVPNYPATPAVPKPDQPALTQAGALARLPRPKPARIAPPRPAALAAAPEPAVAQQTRSFGMTDHRL